MIQLLRQGIYKLIETRNQTKVLILDNKDAYAWINAGEIGEILVVTHKNHPADAVLATGDYVLYTVKNEPYLVDLVHLELQVGNNEWQGYILPTGLPTDKKKRNKIVPSNELITGLATGLT